MLTCTKCGQSKPEGEFYPSSRYKSGYNTWCKECCLAANREYHQSGRRVRNRWRKYGLSDEEFSSLGDVCAICGVDVPKLDIDHDHSTGRVRGLLCRPCNSGLGMFNDDPERLRAAAEYLEQEAVVSC